MGTGPRTPSCHLGMLQGSRCLRCQPPTPPLGRPSASLVRKKGMLGLCFQYHCSVFKGKTPTMEEGRVRETVFLSIYHVLS